VKGSYDKLTGKGKEGVRGVFKSWDGKKRRVLVVVCGGKGGHFLRVDIPKKTTPHPRTARQNKKQEEKKEPIHHTRDRREGGKRRQFLWTFCNCEKKREVLPFLWRREGGYRTVCCVEEKRELGRHRTLRCPSQESEKKGTKIYRRDYRLKNQRKKKSTITVEGFRRALMLSGEGMRRGGEKLT